MTTGMALTTLPTAVALDPAQVGGLHPARTGPADRSSIEDVLALLVEHADRIGFSVDRTRQIRRSASAILEWLHMHPGEGWQQRWLSAGADMRLDWLDTLPTDSPAPGHAEKHSTPTRFAYHRPGRPRQDGRASQTRRPAGAGQARAAHRSRRRPVDQRRFRRLPAMGAAAKRADPARNSPRVGPAAPHRDPTEDPHLQSASACRATLHRRTRRPVPAALHAGPRCARALSRRASTRP